VLRAPSGVARTIGTTMRLPGYPPDYAAVFEAALHGMVVSCTGVDEISEAAIWRLAEQILAEDGVVVGLSDPERP